MTKLEEEVAIANTLQVSSNGDTLNNEAKIDDDIERGIMECDRKRAEEAHKKFVFDLLLGFIVVKIIIILAMVIG